MDSVPESYILHLKKRASHNNLNLSKVAWEALSTIPRSYFVGNKISDAYRDFPLPILSGQTISAPHMYAMMLSIEITNPGPGMKILEIGTGSGYGAALLAHITKPEIVHSIERHESLVNFARENIAKTNLDNVKIILGDGTKGVQGMFFDRILITAAGPRIPQSLFNQLEEGGRIIMPLQEKHREQWLVTIDKRKGKPHIQKQFQVRFVPLIGEEGF